MTEKIKIRYYLLSVILPIVCIVIMFGYATKYVHDEINTTKHELLGLKKANEIHSIIIHLQKLRGIINMSIESKKYSLEKKQIIFETRNKINKLRDRLKPSEKNHPAHQSIYIFLSSILQLFEEQHNFTKHENFNNYSRINEKSFEIQKDISFYSSLILDSEKNSYMLMETIIVQLPKLIEYNGQLRALLTAQGERIITKKEFIDLSNRISIITDLSHTLQYNMNKIFEANKHETKKLKNYYENTVNANHILQNFIYLNFKDNITLGNSEKIFDFFTKNINSMIALYNLNSEVLKSVLEDRLEAKISLSNYIISFGLLCVVFILYNYFNYYRKNNDLISTINNSNIQLKEQSISDSLTNLYNRRYFDIIFKEKINQASQDNISLVFIMCDVDYFKKYNDTYGHSMGDETLIRVANALKESLKESTDFAFRIGGEEFGILVSNMTFEKAQCFAKTIKYNIEKLDIEHVSNEINDLLTISMGLAYLDEYSDVSVIQDMYNCADKALYESKENGRNQITSCELS